MTSPLDVIEKAAPMLEEPKIAQAVRGVTADCSDIRNAERLVEWHVDELRHCHVWNKWLGWDGRRWVVDDSGGANRRATETARRMFAIALDEHADAMRASAAAQDDEKLKDIVKTKQKALAWAFKSQASGVLAAMLSLGKHYQEIVVKHNELDVDPWLFNVANGTIDLRNGILRKHDRADRITKLGGVEYDPEAKCPTWDAFVSNAMLGNDELVAFLARAIGYAMTGVTTEHALLFFWGKGKNGKSTFITTIAKMMGDYAVRAPRGLLFKSGNDRHPTELACLFGARFVPCSEVQEDQALDEALVKDLTGGDTIAARKMREDFWEFHPTHKLFLAGNHKPKVRGDDDGIWRRIKLVPWLLNVATKDIDLTLPERLLAELPGILAWSVRGCLDWQAGGLRAPEDVTKATATYREESDEFLEFLSLHCVLEDGAKVARAALRGCYDDYCRESGIRNALSSKAFGNALRNRGVVDGGTIRIPSKVSPVNAWSNIRLLSDAERPYIRSAVVG